MTEPLKETFFKIGRTECPEYSYRCLTCEVVLKEIVPVLCSYIRTVPGNNTKKGLGGRGGGDNKNFGTTFGNPIQFFGGTQS